MPDVHHLLLFVAAGWLLNLTPGPDVLCIVRHALRGGARAGLLAGLGITAGCFVHVAAAAIGVGALLAASATAFNALKWVGAAYLAYTGLRLLFARADASPLAQARAAPAGMPVAPRRVFLDGFWTNVLNPKVALFFLAFVPQFIAPGTPHAAWVFVLLGVLFNLNAMPVNAGWALAAAWMARRRGVQRGLAWLDRAAGILFIGFGLRLAWADGPAAAR
jgi:threonine/homoserine/homoserine lactone efflux protein